VSAYQHARSSTEFHAGQLNRDIAHRGGENAAGRVRRFERYLTGGTPGTPNAAAGPRRPSLLEIVHARRRARAAKVAQAGGVIRIPRRIVETTRPKSLERHALWRERIATRGGMRVGRIRLAEALRALPRYFAAAPKVTGLRAAIRQRESTLEQIRHAAVNRAEASPEAAHGYQHGAITRLSVHLKHLARPVVRRLTGGRSARDPVTGIKTVIGGVNIHPEHELYHGTPGGHAIPKLVETLQTKRWGKPEGHVTWPRHHRKARFKWK